MNSFFLANKFVGLVILTTWGILQATAALFLFFFQSAEKRDDLFNILWALVFGFATINILSLVIKRFEPAKRRMSFGELLAILVVVAAAGMLGWEMLYMFHVLPIHLNPQ
jgi:Na+/melibiose symporter-like transporter